MLSEKKLLLKKDDIKELIKPMGGCYATSRITVDGAKIGFMYREEPDFEYDSGWRFMAGDETDEYMEETGNSGVYDVNAIANYDQSIIPYLNLPQGAEMERVPNTDEFKALGS
ncbi:DUF2185 domain-containing protein [Flammeovirgaceae bacterium SG7u.111]|nr:DUF2185 domain-containing protein [Flammeovirgaceae bacterium SG7u.132]WPO34264.1 DUF2185 domain-containing protein [Flammeovirgaceae bacterium SG7u.111]